MIPSWDTSYQSGPMYFIGGKPVGETSFREYLRVSGMTHRQIENYLIEARNMMRVDE